MAGLEHGLGSGAGCAESVCGGPAKFALWRMAPARVAMEVSRETAGSKFVQTIRLSAGDAGKRVEFSNAIDWNTRESNLESDFSADGFERMATYNWDIGTIERPTAEPKKFEVPSHQWIDLTDMSGEFGATILTDCKNGSDKPNDQHDSTDLDSDAGNARRLSRPGARKISGITSLCMASPACARLADGGNRLARATSERSADCV